MADVDFEVRLAARADRLGFAALWARDVPLMIPQGTSLEAVALDDPFLWLSRLAAATSSIALGTAAAVLPLRHPLHLSKFALSMDRLTKGRFILGLGSGDRKAEFAAFGLDEALRGDVFRAHWAIVRSALSPSATEREILLTTAGGYDLALAPKTRIPMLAVGSARQTLQWIAEHAEGWATSGRRTSARANRPLALSTPRASGWDTETIRSIGSSRPSRGPGRPSGAYRNRTARRPLRPGGLLCAAATSRGRTRHSASLAKIAPRPGGRG
ncbi:LLM class flavin-dependent oxidoreductase [Cupriavidus sp. D39]|nr:LLM class flavin-dependent oxidoreductase [Cupriavidus sp. D39]